MNKDTIAETIIEEVIPLTATGAYTAQIFHSFPSPTDVSNEAHRLLGNYGC